MSDPYVYPGTDVLQNKLNITDKAKLATAERMLVAARIMEGVPKGRFDLKHLQSIHRHLFQDVYAWGGEIRTVDIAKGGNNFQEHSMIGRGMDNIHRRVVALGSMRSLSEVQLADHLAHIIGDLNFAHPFREGNGRTQLQYARLLAERAGRQLSIERLSGPEWIKASQEAYETRYEAMKACLNGALRPCVINPARTIDRKR